MLGSRYSIQWVGRCCYSSDTGKSDKVWGWFTYIDPTNPKAKPAYAYVFWGATGKTLSFKRHENRYYSMKRLVDSKVNRKYRQVTVEELDSLWENLYETINNKFIFHLLANDI